MEVALDLAAGSVGGVQDASARGADLGELRLDDLLLPQRLLGCAADGDVEDRSVEPSPAVTGFLGWPRSSTQRTSPSRRLIRYSKLNGRSAFTAS